jgi:hypothetical protein
MKKTERERQVVSSPLTGADFKHRTEAGWRLVALEWERDVEVAQADASGVQTAGREPGKDQLPARVPFGLQVGTESRCLEENPAEREFLVQLMDLMMQEGSYARIADEINRRGFRTRQGTPWSQVSVFEMLPRLIEIGPHLFQSAEWQQRRQASSKAG